jgi:hypothetical protein
MQSASRFLSIVLTVLVSAQASIVVLAGGAGVAQAAATSMPQFSNHLVISEIQTTGDEFVELYNPTAKAANLKGWSLQYKRSSSDYPVAPPNVVVFDESDVIPAYGHFLVAPQAVHGVTPDAISLPGLERIAGTVMLVAGVAPVVSADTPVADKVGYGRLADDGEGSAAPNPPANISIERLPGRGEGNGIDSNNNHEDFAISGPTPQNSAAAPAVPTLPVIDSLAPAHGSFIGTTLPWISATVTDAGSGIDPDGFTLHIDGVAKTPRYDAATGAVTYPAALQAGVHTVHLIATDRAGLKSEATSTFTIDMTAPGLSLDVPPTATSYSTTATLHAFDNVSGIAAMRVSFDGVLDAEPWEAFSQTVTRELVAGATNQLILAQVRDGAGNVSVIAQAPVTVNPVALTAPVTPVSSTVGDTITITWPAVAGASHYLVKYTDGTTLYGPILTNTNSIVISKLDPSKKFRFEVASVDRGGSVSGFTKVFPPAPVKVTPAVAEKTTVVEDVVAQPSTETAATENTTSGQTVAPSPTPSATPSISPSPSPSPEVKGGDDSRSPDWTRIIVALSILIIAAGVATGGWYLYQWLNSRPNGGDKGGRW